MKPIPVFETDLWHAKRSVLCALADLRDKKAPDHPIEMESFHKIITMLMYARSYLDGAKQEYDLLIKERNDETDGH